MKCLRKKAAVRYILASFTTVMLAGFIAGLVLYIYAADELFEKEKKSIEQRLAVVAQDLNAQYDAMQYVMVKITADPRFRSTYRMSNSYYEMEILESLKKYTGYTVLTDKYFLFFNDEEWTYRASGTKSGIDFCLQSMGVSEDKEQIASLLRKADGFTILADSSGTQLLFTYPSSRYVPSQDRMTLVFVIPVSAFEQRVSLLCGELPGEVTLSCKSVDFLTIGEQDKKSYNMQLSARNGFFGVRLHTGRSRINNTTVENMNGLLLTCAMLLLICLGLFLGYSLYRPIGKLSRKLSVDGHGYDEINNIEIAFGDLIRQKENAEAHIRSQYRLIKTQFLKLLLSGDARYSGMLSQSFVGVSLPGPYWGVLALSFEKPLSEEAERDITDQIEDLSDEDIHFYFSQTRYEGVYAILLSMSDDSLISDAAAEIRLLVKEANPCTIGVSSALKEVQFHIALRQAAQSLRGKMKSTVWLDEESGRDSVSDEQLRTIVSAIRTGQSKAEGMFCQMLDDIHDRVNSFLTERYLYDRILYRIMADLKEERQNARVIDLMNSTLQSEDYNGFWSCTRELIRTMTELYANQRHEESGSSRRSRVAVEEIVSYIEENYSSPGLSLDMLADHFELSTRYISNLIKQTTGYTYKDYLINLRMTKAREFLQVGGMSVSEVALNVGYTHLPLFIKAFKRTFGCTPGTLSEEQREALTD